MFLIVVIWFGLNSHRRQGVSRLEGVVTASCIQGLQPENDVQFKRCCTSRGCSVNTKLTLRLDEELIARAKRHSAETGRSVSQLVADFFSLIESQDPGVEVTPRVRALRGVLAGSGLDEDDYRRHLEIKHL